MTGTCSHCPPSSLVGCCGSQGLAGLLTVAQAYTNSEQCVSDVNYRM